MTIDDYRRLVATAKASGATDPTWGRTLAIARMGASACVDSLGPLIDDPSVDVESAYRRLLELAPNQRALNALLATRHLLAIEAESVH